MEAKNTNVVARDELDHAAFDAMMARGLNDAKANHSRPVSDVFTDIRQEISNIDLF